MKHITAKEALERMYAGEILFASLISPLREDSHSANLREFKIHRGRYSDAVHIKSTEGEWEMYHCAINTFLKFKWFLNPNCEASNDNVSNYERIPRRVTEEPIHSLIRPPMDSFDVERWTGTEWILDDGQPGICFSGKDHGSFPIAWYPKCNCGITRKSCPGNIAMERTTSRYRCANGREVV